MHRQAVGAVPGPGEMVRGRLARGVGRVRPVRRGFRECARAAERTVDLVGRDVQEAKGVLVPGWQPVPVLGRRLKQRRRPLNIGGNEVQRLVDGTIHMGFGREMDHRFGTRARENLAQRAAVPDVRSFEGVVRSPRRIAERFDMSGVGEHVDVHDVLSRSHHPPHHARPDEACSAGDQYAFQVCSLAGGSGSGAPNLPVSVAAHRPVRLPCSRGGSVSAAIRMASRTLRTPAVAGPCRRAPLRCSGTATRCRAADRSRGVPCRGLAHGTRSPCRRPPYRAPAS